jgi:branched-chain amino acid aminotransferase
MIFNLNGKLVREEEASVSVLDRGFLYGDGIYETVLVRNSRPFLLGKHLERLRSSAAIIRVDVPWDDGKFVSEIDRLLDANGMTDAALRINISRGVGDWRLSVDGASNPTFLFSLFPIPDYAQDTYTRGWEVIISREFVTMDPVIPALAKTTNRLSLILAKSEAEERGGKEAILLNLQGYLTEGTSSNLFFVKSGVVCTPSLDSGILEGITRSVVMEILEKEGVEIEESTYRPDDLKNADEAFLTFTTAGVVPIYSVDGIVAGKGEAGRVTTKIIDEYNSEVERSTTFTPDDI